MPPADVPLALAFAAGFVATVNPCGFAILPSFVSYYLGTRVSSGRVVEGLLVGLTVTAGFMAVFATVGVLFGLGARAFLRLVPWVTVGVGFVLVALGGWLLAGKHVSLPLPGLRTPVGPGYRSMFLFGVAYAVASLSCTLPVFVLVVGAGLAAGSLPGSVATFLAYALGMSTVLMVLCVGTAGFRELVVRAVRSLLPHMNRISGGLLVLGGGYVAYYWISLLSGQGSGGLVGLMQRFQQRVQAVVLRPGERVWMVVGLGLVLGVVASLLLRGPRRKRAREGEPGEAGPHGEVQAAPPAARGGQGERVAR